MTQEHLSALLDGECSAEELDRLLDAMEQNPSLKDDWSRMSRSRDMAAGVHLKAGQACICAGVMSRLDVLPEEFANPKLVELASHRKFRSWKPMAGLAAAASVAAVALLAGLNYTATQSTGSATTVEASKPTQVYGRQVVVNQPVDEDLDNYLIEHNNSMAEQGMGGTLRYARFAAHTASYRTDGQP
jgi:negative regulator of sigma E activity